MPLRKDVSWHYLIMKRKTAESYKEAIKENNT